MDGMSQKLEQVQAEVNKVIKGKEDVVKKMIIGRNCPIIQNVP